MTNEKEPIKEAQEEEAQETAKQYLPLDTSRAVSLRVGKNTFTYYFRRILKADWERYFAGIVHQTLQTDGVRETVYEAETAGMDLVDRTLIRADGYGILVGLKNWKLALPLKHRMAVGMVLRSVGVANPSDDAPLSDLLEVTLDAEWSTEGAGKTTMYHGLIHRFRQPTIEQLRKFNFETSRVRVEGTAELGVTTYPSRQLVAMKVYDDLIHSVDGYQVNGRPIEDVEAIRREMDGAHKAEAALALFTQGDQVRVI